MAPTVISSPGQLTEPDLIGNRNFWTSYAWPEQGDEWSEAWGGTEAMWYGSILPRIRTMLPAAHILEIGCGFGRVTEHLRAHCERLTALDITQRCVEHCQRRFAGDERIRFVVNDGRSLDGVENDSVDLVVSWDSLVHVEHETIAAYLAQLALKLKPGGRGFIHHSNLGVHASEVGSNDADVRTGGRRVSQTADRFAAACAAVGLRCVSQEIVPFNEMGLWIDAFSVIERDDRRSAAPPRVVYAHDWPAERAIARRLSGAYRRVAGTA